MGDFTRRHLYRPVALMTSSFRCRSVLHRILQDTDLVSATKYRAAAEPETVTLIHNAKNGRSSTKKSFILDAGRLQLDPVKETFGLKTVELILGQCSRKSDFRALRLSKLLLPFCGPVLAV